MGDGTLFRRAGSSAAGVGRAEGEGEAPGKSENNPPSSGAMFVFKSSLFPPCWKRQGRLRCCGCDGREARGSGCVGARSGATGLRAPLQPPRQRPPGHATRPGLAPSPERNAVPSP